MRDERYLLCTGDLPDLAIQAAPAEKTANAFSPFRASLAQLLVRVNKFVGSVRWRRSGIFARKRLSGHDDIADIDVEA